MSNSTNVTFIMALVKKATEDFKKGRSSTNKTANFSEVTALNTELCMVIIANLIEKQESDKIELREEFKSELSRATAPLLTKIDELTAECSNLRFGVDSASQYSRRENLKITGVPYAEDENLREVAKHIFKHTTGNDLDDKDISVVHRIGIPKTEQQNRNQTGPVRQDKPSNIIVRYTVRDIKSQQYKDRKQIRDTPGCDYPNAAIYKMCHHYVVALCMNSGTEWTLLITKYGNLYGVEMAKYLLGQKMKQKWTKKLHQNPHVYSALKTSRLLDSLKQKSRTS